MVRKLRTGPHRFQDFLDLISEDQKADLIDGVIYMASPESVDHNEIIWWLGTVLGQYLEERRLGRLTVNKVAFRLSDMTAPEPDLGIMLGDRVKLPTGSYINGPPDVAVEVVSPDSVDRDYEDKRIRYEEVGVKEYWILDPDESRATFLARNEASERFEEVHLDGTVFRSLAIKGFWLDLSWLWAQPRPGTLSIVERLLNRK